MTVRIRTIKPELPEDETLGSCSRDARLAYVLLITQSDCYGNQRGKPALLKAKLFPYDDDITARDVAAWVGELELAGLVALYRVKSQDYLHLCGWASHQKVNKPSRQTIPPPPTDSEPPEGHENPPESPGVSAPDLDLDRHLDPFPESAEDARPEPVDNRS